MYKFTANLSNSHFYLIKNHFKDGKYTVLVLRAPSRSIQSKDPKCLPTQPKKSNKLLFSTIGAIILTGSAIAYAKHSPPTRRWLEQNMPWANAAVGVVYQEGTTHWDFTMDKWSKATKMLSNFLFGQEGITPLEVPLQANQDLEADAKEAFAPKEYPIPCKIIEPYYVPEAKIPVPEIEPESTVVVTEKCKPAPKETIHVTEEQVNLEKQMMESTKHAVEQYKEALKLCKAYNTVLFRIIETPYECMDKKDLGSLQGLRNEKEAAYKTAAEAAVRAKCAIASLMRHVRSGIKIPPEDIAVLKRYVNDFSNDIANAENAYRECADKAILSDKYWEKVKEAREMYKEELKALFPEIDLNARRLTAYDTDMLLCYTLKQIQYLQNQLAEIQTTRDYEINQAIDCHDEKKLIEAKVAATLAKEIINKEMEFKKRELVLVAQAEKKNREDLKKQFLAAQDALQDKMLKREREVMACLNKTVSERLEQERIQFKKELAEIAGRLKAIEAALKEHASREAEQKRALSLWTAAEALLAATRKGEAKVTIKKELEALEKAGKGDLMVEAVLRGIDPSLKDKGLYSEKHIYDKFTQLEKTASKVALISSQGASLPMYFLSWFQSVILFQPFLEVPFNELHNKPVDFTKLDTFDIISRARYHMDHGNLAHALRYVNLLQGAPRAAAQPWLREVRSYLEIKQAAETVMAHASLASLDKKK